jgi:hypothetical protein
MIVYLPLGGVLDVDETVCNKCQGPREEWYCDKDLFDLVMRPEDQDYMYYGNVCLRCFIHLALHLNQEKELEHYIASFLSPSRLFAPIPFTGPFRVDFNSMSVFSEYNDMPRTRKAI